MTRREGTTIVRGLKQRRSRVIRLVKKNDKGETESEITYRSPSGREIEKRDLYTDEGRSGDAVKLSDTEAAKEIGDKLDKGYVYFF